MAAAEAGAVGLLTERAVGVDLPQIVVEDTRSAMAAVAAELYGNPSHSLTVVGVTGTNGKTTVAHLVGRVLSAAGVRTEVIGTLSGARTTPEAPELQRRLARAGRRRRQSRSRWRSRRTRWPCTASTHVRFAAAVFTNLSPRSPRLPSRRWTTTSRRRPACSPRSSATPRWSTSTIRDGRLPTTRALVPTSPYSLDDAGDLRLAVDGSTFSWRGRASRSRSSDASTSANLLVASRAARVIGIDDEVSPRG